MGAHKWWPRNWANGIMWVQMDCLWRWPYGPECGGQNDHAETSLMVPRAVQPDLYGPRMPSASLSHLGNILMTCNPFRMRFRLCFTATMAVLPCQDSANGAMSNPTDLYGLSNLRASQSHLGNIYNPFGITFWLSLAANMIL